MKIYYIMFARIPTEKAHGLQIAKMCEQFGLQEHDVTLVVPRRKSIPNEDVFSYYGVRKTFSVQYMNVPNLISLSSFIGSIAYKLNVFLFLVRAASAGLEKESVVYTRTPLVAWWFPLTGRRTVHELHNWPESRFHSFVLKRMLRKVTLVVCNSEGTAEAAEEHGITNTLVAPNGVEVEDFDIEVDKVAIRKRLGIPTDKKTIMYIGSLEKWKGVDTLLEASRLLPEDTKVVIIGGREAEVKKLAAEYPNVLFLGQRPYKELPENQQAADVLVVPNSPDSIESQLYTSPIKIFAHLLSGVPTIVSDLPSIRHLVSEREIIFFEAGNISSLLNKLVWVFSKPKRADAIVEYAILQGKSFSWESRANAIVKELETLNGKEEEPK